MTGQYTNHSPADVLSAAADATDRTANMLEESAENMDRAHDAQEASLRRILQTLTANADAIANMALDNFDEMMSKTADARFLLEKEIENELATRHPAYISRYVLITHSLLPYKLCQRVGEVQASILSRLADVSTSVRPSVRPSVRLFFRPKLNEGGFEMPSCAQLTCLPIDL